MGVNMIDDEIMQEIRKVREQILAEADYDLHKLGARLRREINDETIQEIRKVREQMWAEAGYDWDRLFERLRREQEQHPERLVSFAKATDPGAPKETPSGNSAAAKKVEAP